MSNSHQLYQQYKQHLQRAADVKYAIAVLQWDQETYLPKQAAELRARQIATLSEQAHALLTNPELGRLLQELQGMDGLTETGAANVRLSWEDFKKTNKYSAVFVRRMAETTSRAFHTWSEARAADDFKLFEKDLEEIVQLKLEEAQILGFEQHPYDALLNEHDKGSTVQQCDAAFSTLQPPLEALLLRIQNARQADDGFLKLHYPRQQQWDFGMHILRSMGFDFEKGRQDVSAHPFTISFGSSDVRLTTRIDENDFGNMTWSCIHEGGHGLYEQGLPDDEYGLPLGEAASFTVHESQSRLWENMVGRSLPFWKHHYQQLQQQFAQQLGPVSVEQFYRGINRVQPSLIRTEADELTYHLHIIIRYEIEKQLLTGQLKPADIPGLWNHLYRQYLGVTVPDNSRGCLQDVHWSHGSFGYFSTYSMGTAMAAQLYAAYSKEHAGFYEEILRGNTGNLLIWLRNCIHNFGRRFTTNELCERITGEPLNVKYLLEYLDKKFSGIYQL